MFIFALIAYLLFLTSYIIFIISFYYHAKKYSVPDEIPKKTLKIFTIIILILIILSFVAFINVPWDSLLKTI